MKNDSFRKDHLLFGALAAAMILCTIWFFPFTSKESMLVLVAFDFLFVSLIFPLRGPLSGKLLMLSLGNVVGWFWNCALMLLNSAIADGFEGSFGLIHLFLNPFLNLVWIVPFWGFSLSALAGAEKRRMEPSSC